MFFLLKFLNKVNWMMCCCYKRLKKNCFIFKHELIIVKLDPKWRRDLDQSPTGVCCRHPKDPSVSFGGRRMSGGPEHTSESDLRGETLHFFPLVFSNGFQHGGSSWQKAASEHTQKQLCSSNHEQLIRPLTPRSRTWIPPSLSGCNSP